MNTSNGNKWRYHYTIADHLGNARVEFVAHGGAQPEVVQTSSYYPFGMTLRRNDYGSRNVNKRLYGGKELQDQTLAGIALNWYDFEARMYDPTIGRFLQTDPKAEKYFDVSPYTYCLNNPIRIMDPNGKDVQIFEHKDYKTGKTIVTFYVTIRVTNHSKATWDVISERAACIKQQIETSFKGYDEETKTQYETLVQFVNNLDEKFVLDFVNDVEGGNTMTAGKVDEIGNPIKNRIQVEIDGYNGLYNQTKEETSRVGAHEYGHAIGLRHGGDINKGPLIEKNEANLMNQSRVTNSTIIKTEQLEYARECVNEKCEEYENN